jgi:cyclophilin family peptidyl-prolyl cis-trans isomerase
MKQPTIRSRVAGALLGLLAFGMALPTLAQGTLVRLHTTLGPIDMRLLDAETPITVTNFLAYVNGGDYRDVFFHRSVRNFVVQAGGFRWPAASSSCCQAVSSRGQIQNEFNVTRSNVRGTVAMAKVGGNANSATSQWFVNLSDNSGNLDNQNGGFTVFARVTVPSMVVVDRIAALPIVNAGGTFSELPVTGWTAGSVIRRDNLALIERVTVMPATAQQTDADRIFSYLEAAYPQYLSPSEGSAGAADGFTYRYYSETKAYVGVKDGKVWYLVPAVDDKILELGSVVDWLAKAQAAGY